MAAPGAKPHSARVGFAPSYAFLGNASYVGDPINRIRLTARNQSTGEIVGTLVTDVDPNAQDWNLALDITLNSQIEVVVTIELINVVGGVESVQWSGRTDPISVAPAQPTQTTTPVTLYQGPPANLTVTGVVIAPDSAALTEGATTQFTASITGGNGAHAVWSSANPAIATVDQNGLVTAVRNGVTAIFAVAGPRADTARVSVAQRISAVVVTPDTQRLVSVGAEAAFTATALDPRGAQVNGAVLTWTVENSAIADTMGGGRFRAKANGTTRVFATSVANPAVRGTGVLVVAQKPAHVDVAPATATLTAIGAHQTFTATVSDAAGHAFNTPVQFRSANPAIATIDASGIATAVASGSVDISAVAGAAPDTVVGHATLRITQSVASLAIAPSSFAFEAVGDTATLAAVAKDGNGNVVPGIAPTWSSSNPQVAIIDATGVVTALGNGVAVVSAVVGDQRASAGLTVRQKAATVVLQPDTGTLETGHGLRLSATAKDRHENLLAAPHFTWVSANPSILSVDTTGLLTARAVGTTAVTVSIDNASATGTFNVRQSTPTRVVITPDSAQLDALHDFTRLSAVAYDATDVAMPTAHITWSSLDPAIAGVDTTGKVTALATGVARIVATATAADTARVRVQQVVHSLSVSPHAVTLALNDSVRVYPRPYDANDYDITTYAASFSSSNDTIATVSASGVIKARRAGNAVVYTQVGTLTDSTRVTVNAADLAALSFSLSPADSVFEDDSVLATFKARNTGSASAAASGVHFEILNAADSTVMADSTVAIPALNAGDSVVISKVMHADFQVPVDAVALRATVDPANQVAESNESNNVNRTSPLRIRYRVAQIIPSTPRVVLNAVGDTTRISGAPRDRFGRALSRPVTYASKNPAVVSVDSAGLVHALAADSTYIMLLSEHRADSLLAVVSQVVSQVTAVSGDTQTATVNQEANDSLGVQVLDSNGHGIPGITVTWTPVDGTVSTSPVDVLTSGIGMRPFLAPITSRTNASGVARAKWKLGTRAGRQSLQACIADGTCVTFSARGRADRPHGGAIRKGDGQFATVGTVAGDSLIVAVSDQFGNAVPNARVDWVARGGHVSATNTLTDSLGIALVQFTADTVKGPKTVDANVFDSLTVVATETFHLNGKAGKPAQSSKRHGEGITATVSPTLGDSIEIQLRDQYGNTVDSTRVQWDVQEGNGKLAGGVTSYITTTDTAGVTYVKWTLGTKAGRHRLRATLLDAATPITLDFTDNPKADAASKAHSQKLHGNDQTLTVKTSGDSLVAQVNDQYDNPVAGARIYWLVPDTSHSVSPAMSVADSTGRAATRYTAGRAKGTWSIVASVQDSSGVVLYSDTFKVRAKAGKPAGRSARHGGGLTATVSPTLGDSLELELTDAYGNTVDSTWVRWEVKSGNGTLANGRDTMSTMTDANGRARIEWTLGTKAGAHKVRVTALDSTAITLDFDNNTKAAAANRSRSGKTRGDNQTITVKQAGDSLQVMLQDTFGNAVANVPVQFSPSDTSQVISPSMVVTGADGRASVQYTMGRTKGLQQVVVDMLDSLTHAVLLSDTFHLKGKADKPAQSSKRHGEGITATVSPTLGDSIEIELRDQYGNTVDSTRVQWDVQEGNGKLAGGVTSYITTTDTAGVTYINWTLGTKAGRHRLRATLLDAATPITIDFTDNPHADKAHGASKTKGDGQYATVATIANDSLALTVSDQYGNPVPDATVHWTISAGSLDQTSTMTDSTGATRVQYTFATRKGNVTAIATVLDDSLHVLASDTFRLRGRAANPQSASSTHGGDLTAVVSPTLSDSLQIHVLDQYGNSVDSTLVRFRVMGGGGKFNGQDTVTVMTDSDGYAAVHWTMGTKAGLHRVRATVLSGVEVLVDFQNTARADQPHGSGKLKGDQDAVVGTVAGDSLIVSVSDQYGNPVPNATVRWAATGGTVSDSITLTTDSGVALTRFTVGTVKGPKSALATVYDSTGVIGTQSFAINGKADKAARAVRTNSSRSKHGATVAATLTDTVSVKFTDQYGNSIEGGSANWNKLEGDSSALGTVGPSTDTSGTVSGLWVLGHKAGRHKIAIQVDTMTFTLTDSTVAGPVKKLHLSQSSKQFDALGDSLDLTTTPTDTFDNPVSTATTWSSSDTAKTSVSASGRIKSRNNGNAKVFATAGGYTDSVTVSVAQRIKFLTIDQRHDTITALQFKQRMTQTQKDRNGNPISDSTYRSAVTWQSSNDSIATFVGDSLLSVANGTVLVYARAAVDNTILDSVFVEIKQASSTTITLSGTTTVLLNATTIITASGMDSNGHAINKWSWSVTAQTGNATISYAPNSSEQVTVTGTVGGTVLLTATTPKGQTKSVVITVQPPS